MAQRVLCLLVFLIPALAHSGEQPPSALVPGTRVRVTAPGIAPKPLVGTVRRLADDAIDLTVKGGDDVISVSRANVIKLEVSKGRNRSKGALIGGAAVAAVGAVVGAVGCRDSSDLNSWICGAVMGGCGFALGGGVGAIVGSGDHWRELPSDRFRVTFTPTNGRGVGLSMRFTF